MGQMGQPIVELRAWSDDDLPLLHRILGDPAMTVYLGGPETPEQLKERHERYRRGGEPGQDKMFVILVGPEKQPAGMIGYWKHNSNAGHLMETGWAVLCEFQGRGVARRALALIVERARAEGGFRYLHAYSDVDNAASNAVARQSGFELLGQVDFDDPPGHMSHCNEWRLDLESVWVISHAAEQEASG